MKEYYRLNLRFDQNDPEERRISEALKSLDREKHGSINSFAVRAIGEALERIGRPYQCDFTLEDVRAVVREELSDIDFSPRQPELKPKMPAEMTEEERLENDRNVLESLMLFG
jgi:hypothetical protein